MGAHSFGQTAYPFQNANTNLANCLFNYQNWPSTGTTIPNGTANYPTYNGVAGANDYVLQSSGATSFNLTSATDRIRAPGQTAPVENIANITIEIGCYLTTFTNYNYLLSKGAASSAGWGLCLYPTNTFAVLRFATNGSSTSKWQAPNGSFAAGGYYAIAITQNVGTFGAAPTLMINGAPVSLTASTAGSPVDYHTDAAYDFVLGNNDWNSGNQVPMTVYWWRVHNAILTPQQLLNNFAADRWRMGWYW